MPAHLSSEIATYPCKWQGISERHISLYKLIYSNKRFIVFRNVVRLTSYLKSVDIANRDFRLYKKGK